MVGGFLNSTPAVVPSAYPDPAAVIVPVIDWISTDSVAPVPAPPTIVRVGALV